MSPELELSFACAGISVSCGIPDFRSSGGIYARLKREYPQLSRPEDMFDFDVFKSDPRPFYSFAKDNFPGRFKPSITHQFIRSLERRSKLLQNYTQNIDTLERVAGISKVCYCHGSFATASCMDCRRSFSGEDLREAIMSQHIPYCPHCNPEIGLKGISAISNSHFPSAGLVKPDIVFFKENLPSLFTNCIEMDRNETDLLLVIGTSLQVYPVASIPRYLPANIPKVLINREPIDDLKFDFELIGDCDVIIRHLCSELNWNLDCEESDGKTSASPLSKVDLSVSLKAALKALGTPVASKDMNKSGEVKFNLAQFLPKNTFTEVQERLYVFEGSELTLSRQTAAEYLGKYFPIYGDYLRQTKIPSFDEMVIWLFEKARALVLIISMNFTSNKVASLLLTLEPMTPTPNCHVKSAYQIKLSCFTKNYTNTHPHTLTAHIAQAPLSPSVPISPSSLSTSIVNSLYVK
ncbi:hypothetical protein ACTXT7_000771 [Hymenolepis weldensis]